MTEAEPAAQAFRRAAADAVDELLRSRPEQATELGDHRSDSTLSDLSPQGISATAARFRQHLVTLGAVPPAGLGGEDRVDLSMLIGELHRRLFLLDDLALHTWDPLVYNAGSAFYPLVSREVRPLPERVQAIADRLQALPAYLACARRNLEAPPRVHVETALRQHEGVVSLVRDEVSRVAAPVRGLTLVVEAAQQKALAALESHQSFLAGLLEGVHRSPRLGPELFARRLALELHSLIEPSEVLDRARQWLGEVEGDLHRAAREFVGEEGESPAETVRAALERVAADHPDDTTVLGAVREALERGTAAVGSAGFVSLPDQPLRVEPTPPFRRGVAGAYCDPSGPLEDGGETVFSIEPTPEEWSAAQKTSFYREYNHAMLVNLTVHEAMPGHMVQLAHARRFQGSTIARKVLESGTFVEGWAVHAERIMAEHGHGGPAVRLQQLKMQLRVGLNAIVDVCTHAADMDEEGAVELMMGRGYQEESEARFKWRRACLTSAQLSTYFVGYSELADLFSRLGDRLDYNEVLAHGSPPPRLLGELLER